MNYENRDKINSVFNIIDTCEHKIELLNKLSYYLYNAPLHDIIIRFSMVDGMSNYTQIDLSDDLESVEKLVDSYKELLEYRIREAKDILKEL